MADTADEPVTSVDQADADRAETPDAESLAELVWMVLWDGVIGAIAGAGGSVVILTTLVLAAQVGAFDPAEFATVAELLGLEAVLSGSQLVYAGVAVFVVGGMVTLPLLLVTVGAFLPGRRYATRGLSFGAVVWTGFVLAYYPGYSGWTLVLYVAATLAGHLGYGYVTGFLMDHMFAGEGRPVIVQSLRAPAQRTQESGGSAQRESTLVDEDDEAGT